MTKTAKKTRAERLRAKNVKAATAHCDRVRKRIVQTRKDRSLTITEVARNMGISRSFYSQLERGARGMSLVNFLMICRALQVEPGELLK